MEKEKLVPWKRWEVKLNPIKDLRSDFYRMVVRCSCLLKKNHKICSPDKCFPSLYEELFPKGGFPWWALRREMGLENDMRLEPPETNRKTNPLKKKKDRKKGEQTHEFKF